MIRFADNSDGTITDSLTTLIWSQTANTPTVAACGASDMKTWVESLNHIACLNANNYLGFNDWRLPNNNELMSLLDFNRNNLSVNSIVAPYLDPNAFTLLDLLPPEPFVITRYPGFWSSTAKANSSLDTPDSAYALVDDVEFLPIFINLDVWPVRGGQTYDQSGQTYVPATGKTYSIYPRDDGAVRAGVPLPVKESRFTVNANGTTTDRFTDLTWTTTAGLSENAVPPACSGTPGPMTWLQSLDLIACLNRNNYRSFSDWRLPNVRELDSISKTRGDPLAGEGVYIDHFVPYFLNVQFNGGYWSSNSFLNQSTRAWVVNVTTGAHGNFALDSGDLFAVWPVRGGVFADTEKPVVTEFTIPFTTQGTFAINSLTATDNMVVTRYCVSESSSPDTCNMVYPTPITYTLSGIDGFRTLYAYALDSRNNVSNPVEATILFDTTPPLITVFSLSAQPSGNLTASVAMGLDTLTMVSGLCLTESSSSADCTWQIDSVPTAYTFSHTGDNVLHAFARDIAGNISNMATASVYIPDATVPNITSFTLPATAISLNVAVTTFAASDNLGVTGYCLTESSNIATCSWTGTAPTAYTFSSGGARDLYAFVRDADGNASAVQSATVSITLTDFTAPSITFNLAATSSSEYVEFTVSATDDVAVTGYKVTDTGTPPDILTGGWSNPGNPPYNWLFTGTPVETATTRTLYAWAKDAAGNVAGISRSITITIPDLSPPAISFGISATSARLTVPVTISATDQGTGIINGYCLSESSDPATCTWLGTAPNSYPFAAFGTFTLYAFARDASGNIGTTSRVVIVQDISPPTVQSISLLPLNNSRTAQVNIVVLDDGDITSYCLSESTDPATCSWQASRPMSYTFSSYGPGKRLYGFARDLAGHQSSTLASSNIIFVTDSQPPVINTFTASGTAASLTATITAFTATDNDSVSGYCIRETNSSAGCSWQAATITSFTFATAGPKFLFAFARDSSGNIGSFPQRAVTVGDQLAPAISAFTLQLPATSPTVNIATFTSSDNVGVIDFCLTEVNNSSGCSWSPTQPTGYTFSNVAQGVLASRSLFSWVRDAAGNVSASRSAGVPFNLPDTTAPVITAFTLPNISASATVPFTAFTATDNVAVTGYCLRENASTAECIWSATVPTGYTFPGIPAGEPVPKVLYGWVKDAANNITATTPVTVALQMINGDVNGTGVLDIADALQLFRHLILGVPMEATAIQRADVAPIGAPDNILDINDVLILLRRVVYGT